MRTNIVAMGVIVTIALLIAVPVVAGSGYVPENYARSTNYYDVTGEPHISTTLVGDYEFDRGDDAVLEITLSNDGEIYRIKGDKYLDPGEKEYKDEIKLAAIELETELERTSADRVTAALFADDAPIDVTPDAQEIESIESGKTGTVRFPVHIDDDAPSGTYRLRMEICYNHIRNVQVGGTPDHPDINYWNTTDAQSQTITIIVEKEADFEVTDVVSGMQVEETGFLNITYQNIGEETATDAVARISDMLPFTAVTNQKRLGTMAPGESVTTHFRISTDRDAVPKVYSISSVIRFRDEDNDIQISDPMQIGVSVAPKVPFSEKLSAKKWWIAAAVVLLAVFMSWRVRKRWELRRG